MHRRTHVASIVTNTRASPRETCVPEVHSAPFLRYVNQLSSTPNGSNHRMKAITTTAAARRPVVASAYGYGYRYARDNALEAATPKKYAPPTYSAQIAAAPHTQSMGLVP